MKSKLAATHGVEQLVVRYAEVEALETVQVVSEGSLLKAFIPYWYTGISKKKIPQQGGPKPSLETLS